MYCECAESVDEAAEIIRELINDGDTVSVGGSMTLFEAGIIDMIRDGDYRFLDRYENGLTKEEIREVFIKSFDADVYITSTNAVTERGELYNIDGSGNRVAAMIYGPRSVIVLAGYNKIVKNLDEAKMRLEEIAAPANAIRLDMNTPCTATGRCMNCSSEDRICADTVIMARQRIKDRIKVILVGEELGY